MLGLCLVAVLAVCAYAVSSASAGTPEMGQCVAKAGGKYADSNCQTKAKKGDGAYEWHKWNELSSNQIDTKAGAGTLTTTVIICGGAENKEKCSSEEGEEAFSATVECTHEAGGGVVSGKDTLKDIAVQFSGCKAFGSLPCTNSSEAEVINVNPLNGTLGYINKAKKEVGVDLNPAVKNEPFAKFNCGGILETTVGVAGKKEFPYYGSKGGGDGILSPITPINQMTKEMVQTYTINSETLENIPSKFEGKSLQLLEDYISSGVGTRSKWGPGGESIVNTTLFGPVGGGKEEAEIKA